MHESLWMQCTHTHTAGPSSISYRHTHTHGWMSSRDVGAKTHICHCCPAVAHAIRRIVDIHPTRKGAGGGGDEKGGANNKQKQQQRESNNSSIPRIKMRSWAEREKERAAPGALLKSSFGK